MHVPAKVNLFLAVRGLRDDGYHELVSIMQTVSLRDTVTATMDADPANLHPAMRRLLAIRFTHDGTPGVPAGDSNLAVQAAQAMLKHVRGGAGGNGENTLVTHLHLSKEIPVAAGMAGGSADAAAALLALNTLWDGGLDRDELRGMAAELGADVPFCVTGGTALATGTGTATAQVLCRGTFHWVVGMSDEALSTPEVYQAFDDHGTPTEMEPDAVLQALRTGDAEALGAALHNDLQEAAFHLRPELRHAVDACYEAGSLGAIVSGSGPTVVALAENAAEAHRLAREISGHFDRVEVAASPAGGPQLSLR